MVSRVSYILAHTAQTFENKPTVCRTGFQKNNYRLKYSEGFLLEKLLCRGLPGVLKVM